METFTDCPVSSYRRHTVLAVVFASLDEANPCPLSNATARRMLLFGLVAAQLPLLLPLLRPLHCCGYHV